MENLHFTNFKGCPKSWPEAILIPLEFQFSGKMKWKPDGSDGSSFLGLNWASPAAKRSVFVSHCMKWSENHTESMFTMEQAC